jgi:EAL domain-containing protein (putative c-di-GMP-specific phosphodiesterase class I)
MAGAVGAETATRSRRDTDRERFLTFALAAAEILLEVSPQGEILFAAGALQSRFGSPAEAWVGRQVSGLVALADRGAFEVAFGTLLARDRLPPTSFRLANRSGARMTFGGLRLPDRGAGRVCLTIAALPHGPEPATGAAGRAPLRDLAEAAARDGQFPGQLSLIELQTAAGPLAPDASLAEALRDTLAEAIAPDAVAGELVAGRYGVIAQDADDLGRIGARLAEVAQAAGHAATAASRSLSLASDGLTAMQATRALRHALNSFASGGPEAIDRAGGAAGLTGMVEAAYARAAWLRRAITERQFHMAFQPIVRLADRSIHHWEALVRPDTDSADPLSQPQEFVTFAETVGLSEELDWAVLAAVCSAARGARNTRIAANLSGLSLQSPAFRARLLGLLDAEPLLAHRLLFEITETAEIENEAEAVATVEALRERGLPLCIDDFGAGAAAFRYLRAFRVDKVKIDGLYVMNAARSPQDRGIVSAMVDLAHTVGAEVVAERIETEAEAALMLELGVEFGQGWLYGRPGPLPTKP